MTCDDACYKASSNMHIETEVETFYLRAYFYIWVSVHVHYSDFSIMVYISNKAIECYALFTFSTIVQHYSFVLTSIDSKWTFGFCRHDPKTETALVLLSYLPWHESFYKWVSVLQWYGVNSCKLHRCFIEAESWSCHVLGDCSVHVRIDVICSCCLCGCEIWGVILMKREGWDF